MSGLTAGQKKIKKWREDPVSFVVDELKATPDAWQVEVLRAFPSTQRIAMKAPLSLDNIVYTPDGEKRWGDIRKGDDVFDENGEPTKVLRRYDVGEKEVYRVTFRDKSWVDVCLEHEWKVQNAYDRRAGSYRTLNTSQILKNGLKLKTGQRVFNVPPQGPAQYKTSRLPLDPYIFGLWIGDGCRNEPSIICPDPSIREQIEKLGFKTSLKKNKKTIRILDSNEMFLGTGINNLYCYEKWIPDLYKFSSKKQRLALLQGLMDSDGTTTLNNQTYYAGSSERLIDDVIWLARSLGYLANKNGPYKINGGINRDTFRAVIAGPDCPFLADTSKKRRWKKPGKFRYTRFIDSIILAGKKKCMCIEVESPSHCFLANDFIVTHNCKGPGKTTIESWCAWNFLATRPHPNIGATSISADNLGDCLWKEMAKWQGRSEFLKKAFIWTKTRIFSREYPQTWWMSARAWAKTGDSNQQADTLAGLHADYMLFILDEVGGIPDAVMVAAEAGLASGIETKILMGGNPTHLTGPLYRACTLERHLWYIIEISGAPDDPMRSPRVSIQWAKDQIETYGKDNPWVLVNVFGQFPPSSINSLLGPEEVMAAMKRHLREDQYNWAQKRLGIDAAWRGDDKWVIFPRQGLASFMPVAMRNPKTEEIGSRIILAKQRFKSEREYFDDTGGFAAGASDYFAAAGYTPIRIDFSSPATDPRFFNKRSEMHWLAAQAIKKGAALPNVPELVAEASTPTYTYKNGKMLMEPKDLVKARIGRSPDYWDAYTLTYAEPDMPAAESPQGMAMFGAKKFAAEYDPFESERMDA